MSIYGIRKYFSESSSQMKILDFNRCSNKYKEHIPYTGISLSLWAFELYITGNFYTINLIPHHRTSRIQLITPLVNKNPCHKIIVKIFHKLNKILRTFLSTQEKLNNYSNNGNVVSIIKIETLFLDSHVLLTFDYYLKNEN